MIAATVLAYTDAEQKWIEGARAYVTNDALAAEQAYIGGLISTNSAYCAELDDILVVKPPLYVLHSVKCATTVPRTYAAAITKYAESKPAMVKAATEGTQVHLLKAADRVEWYVEYHSSYLTGKNALKSFKAAVGECLGKLIDRTLRRQGKSVVTRPDGTSPVKEYAERISAALDAPRFTGLNDILAEMGIRARFDVSHLGTADQANALMEEIMDGEKELNGQAEFIITTALGVAAYNQFVERYNGGK